MRPFIFMLSILLLASAIPTTTMAAEALNNSKLENAYIPEAKPCLPGKNKKHAEGCSERSGSQAVTDKALRDAEQQNTRQLLNNPQINNPDLLPPPPELPPPSIQQQNLLRHMENIQHSPAPAPAP